MALVDQTVNYATTPWHCVKDEVTGLIWEVKTNDNGLHDKNDLYRWYNTDTTNNGGSDGFAGLGSNLCFGYDNADNTTYCNTQAYVARVNAATRCGANDWRLPTREELISIVDYERGNPAIDTTIPITNYFPNTVPNSFWSSSPSASRSDSAWVLVFSFGYYDVDNKVTAERVRLVRSRQ